MRRRLSVRIAGFLVALGATLSACNEETLQIGGDLALVISSNAPISVSDSLVVTYDIQGRALLGMIVDWGDAEIDSLAFSGAQTAGGRVAHLYAGPGTYTVEALVEDAVEGSLTEQLAVTVNP